MYIPEYRKIQKGGKIVVSESPEHNLVQNFVEQMEDRGLTVFCAFVNKEKVTENVMKMRDLKKQLTHEDISKVEYEMEVEDMEHPGLVDWSESFYDDDMKDIVMAYMTRLPKRMKLQFISSLSNMIMSEVIYQEPIFFDDEEMMEDYEESEYEGEDDFGASFDEDDDEDDDAGDDWKN
jgi:hypothetical protein